MKIDLEKMDADWPSPFVARNKINEFTKGGNKKSTMATYDAAGQGVARRFVLNKTIFYLKSDLIEWLRLRKRG